MANLTSEHLIAAIARDSTYSKAVVKDVLDSLTLITTNSVASGETVILPGIGRVKPAIRAARNQRNPKTGEMMACPAIRVVKFTPATALTTALPPL